MDLEYRYELVWTSSMDLEYRYELVWTSVNMTETVHRIVKNQLLFGNRAYVIGYRIIVSFLLIYVIPMLTLVALNGRLTDFEMKLLSLGGRPLRQGCW